MKYTNTKLTPWMLLGLLLALSCCDVARATTTISRRHTDIFEAEYITKDEDTGDALTTPQLHLGVHADQFGVLVNGTVVGVHYEPGDVLLEVGSAAYGSTTAFSPTITSLLGANAWILPVDLEQADISGLIEAGVAKDGFPDAEPVTFTMVAAGAANPGNFALFTTGSSIRLSATGSEVETSSFSYAGSHVHYNWGFSAPGIYTFDMKASYTDSSFGALESATETYTFNVIPEPSSSTMLLIGLVGWVATRKRVVLKE